MPATENAAKRAAQLSLAVTSANVAVKLVAGVMSGSVSVLAEALQSGVDILTSFGVLKAIQVAEAPPDDDHPYGHGKAEHLVAIGQMLIVLVTSAIIGFQAYKRLNTPTEIHLDLGIAAMVFALVANTLLIRKLTGVANRTGSTAIASEVIHLRSDSQAAIGIIVGLLLVWLTGKLWIDPLVAIACMVLPIVLAVRQMRRLLHPLMDGALPAEEMAAIEETLQRNPDVRGFHNVRARSLGSRRHVELHVLLDDDLPFVAAHDMAEVIESELSAALDGALVSVHYEPYQAEMEHRRAEHGEE